MSIVTYTVNLIMSRYWTCMGLLCIQIFLPSGLWGEVVGRGLVLGSVEGIFVGLLLVIETVFGATVDGWANKSRQFIRTFSFTPKGRKTNEHRRNHFSEGSL